jgi:hypothetical protein
MLKVVRWDDDDAIIHDPLRIVTTVTLDHTVTTMNLDTIVALVTIVAMINIHGRLYSCTSSRMTGQIFMKFGMDVTPLVTTPNS